MNTKRTSRWALAAALCGAAGLAACGGDNLFDMQANPNVQPTVSVFSPAFVSAGDTFTVNVQATAALNLQSIAVQVRGAVTKDTLIVSAPARTATASLRLTVPAVPTSTSVLINAQAVDVHGQASPQAADTVLVIN